MDDKLSRSVTVKLKSVQHSLDDGEKINVSFECGGSLSNENGALLLCYDEPSGGDLTACRVTLAFYPDSVVMKKTGNACCETRFSGDDCVSVYKTPLGAFNLKISDTTIKNKMTDSGGTLILDYISQLAGLDPQRIKMRIDVVPKEERP